MRKIIVAIYVLLFTSFVYAKTQSVESRIIEAYKTGHQQGVNQIEREFDLQGWQKKKIYPKKYLVVLDISNIPQYEILLYKNYAFFEGLLPLTVKSPSKNIILFASYDRKIDAESLAKDLNKKIPVEKSKIVEETRENGEYYKTPFIYKYLFDKMLKEIKQSVKGKIFIVKQPTQAKTQPKPTIVKTAPKPKVVKKSSPKPKKKRVVLVKKLYQPKYKKVQAYKYTGSWIRYDSKKWKDNKFKFIKFIPQNSVIESYNTITTKRGIKYVKIANKNMYVEADYVKRIK